MSDFSDKRKVTIPKCMYLFHRDIFSLFADLFTLDLQIKMEEQNGGDMHIQTLIILWDINLKINTKGGDVDIFTPTFSFSSAGTENANWIRLYACKKTITIISNFSSKKEFISCTTFRINPTTNTVLVVYKGFKSFSWNNNKWSKKMRFVFELKLQCASAADPPIIWKRCAIEIQPPTNMNGLLLTLESESGSHTVQNNQGVRCVVKSYRNANASSPYSLDVSPATPVDNWNLFTVMVRKLEDNILQWNFWHSRSANPSRSYQKFYPHIIFEIKELIMSFVNMSEFDIDAVTKIITPHLTPSSNLNVKFTAILSEDEPQSKPSEQELHYQQNISTKLMEYFVANKYCDVTIHAQDQQIRAHKIALSAGSIIWQDLFDKNVTLTTIHIADFDYGTIKDMIEYMYSGKVKQTSDQLFIAADKYRVTGLKELCEEKLSQTIEIKSSVNLLVLAERYKATLLYDKVIDFIDENCEAFKKLEEANGMFMMYPELGFKLFKRLC